MKKLSYIIGGIGFIIFGIAGSCDFTEYPIIAIPIVVGVLLMSISYYIEKTWYFEEFEDFNMDECYTDNTDDGITYIEYDTRGNLIFLDNKEKVLPPTKVTEPIRENE